MDWTQKIRASADLSTLTDEQIAELEEFRRFSSYLPSDDHVNVLNTTLDEEDFFVRRLLSRPSEESVGGDWEAEDGDEYYDDGYDYAGAAYSSGNEMLESDSDEDDEPQTQPLAQAPPTRVPPTLPPKPRLIGSGNTGNLSASPPSQGFLSFSFSFSFSYCFAPMAFLFLLPFSSSSFSFKI